MTNQEVRAFTAAIILAGKYAEGDSVRRDLMVLEAIITTDALLEGLSDTGPLRKRIVDWSESRRKDTTPPKLQKTPVYATQDFIDRLPESDRGMYTPLVNVV